MTKTTYTDTLQRIESLRVQAEEMRKKEVVPVIERIRHAVEIYQIKPEDIFGNKVVMASSVGVARRQGGRAAATKVAGAERRGFRMGDRYWSGIGKRPNWFKEALAQGKTPEELRA